MSTRFRWLADPVVRRQLGAVERLLAGVAQDSGGCVPFHEQLLSPRCKRLRPALVLLAARFGPRAPEDGLVRAAAGIELLHEATLYHDDIVDEATLRRGRPTVQGRHGSAVAAFAGSELLYATADLFADLPPRLRRSVGRTGEALCRGQLREIETLGDVDLTIRERVRIMRAKTASLFALAARIGAVVAGAGDAAVARLARFGMRFGLCFQLADDLRDLVGTRRSLGRAPGADLDDGVYSLPILLALHARAPEASALHAALAQSQRTPRRSLTAAARRLVRRGSAIERSLALLRAWMRSAMLELEAPPLLGPQAAVQSLRALVCQVDVGLVRSSPGAPPPSVRGHRGRSIAPVN